MKTIEIYTDGACSGNPGPGGYGAVLIYGETQKEISAGYELTTNNRMEIMAAVAALELLNQPCEITLYSDSRYLVDAIEKGWVEKWRANNWKRTKTEKALNVDLWLRLTDAVQKHKIVFKWVKGHSSNPLNNRCDELARQAAAGENLFQDIEYESISKEEK